MKAMEQHTVSNLSMDLTRELDTLESDLKRLLLRKAELECHTKEPMAPLPSEDRNLLGRERLDVKQDLEWVIRRKNSLSHHINELDNSGGDSPMNNRRFLLHAESKDLESEYRRLTERQSQLELITS